jgi:pyruvate dehydrogenase E2 component (dihydrolipoamide acetyltransferase)
MAIEVKVPKISEGVESAEVTEVLVSEGDTIDEEQSVIAVETDKASVEVPSSDGGKVKEIKVKAGDEIKVGDVILILEEADGRKEEKDKGKEKDKEEKDTKAEKEKEGKKEEAEEKSEKEEKEKAKEGEDVKAEKTEEKEKETERKEEEPEETSGQVPASPSVRRLARELGVDIKAVEGSGPGGRITEEDVKSYTKGGKKKEAPTALSLPDFAQWGSVEREPLSNIRLTTANTLTASWQSIPHVFQFDEADISGIEEYMEHNSEKAEKAGGKLTITAVLAKVVANALQQFPKFNASIDMENEEMILKKYVNIGIAADTDKGLLVPVIRDVDKKSIIELAVEITELAEKARNQKLSPEDMQGGSFTVSNLGGIGGTNFTPVVYHPQVAILGVSRVSTKPAFIDGNFEPRHILPLSLSYDHRLIDGAEGAKFLRWICQALEDPYKALLGA